MQEQINCTSAETKNMHHFPDTLCAAIHTSTWFFFAPTHTHTMCKPFASSTPATHTHTSPWFSCPLSLHNTIIFMYVQHTSSTSSNPHIGMRTPPPRSFSILLIHNPPLISCHLTTTCYYNVVPSHFFSFFGARYTPTTTAWSRSYGSRVTCSLGLSCCSISFFTSRLNTASGGAVLSMHDALMLMTKLPPFLRKKEALYPTIRAWGGWYVGGGL